MRIALVTGTSGIGESTTGCAVAERTASKGRASAVFDVDELSRLWSTRDGDPFNTGLILRNLASIVEERLRQRHHGAELDGLAWHIDRAPELVAIRDRRLQLPVATRQVCSTESSTQSSTPHLTAARQRPDLQRRRTPSPPSIDRSSRCR